MADEPNSPRGSRLVLPVLGLACLATVAALAWREAGSDRPYKQLQLRQAQAQRAAGKPAPRPGIRRLHAAGRVDRCPTCHLGKHSGKLLATHPPQRFGCTTCHGAGGGYVDRCLPSVGDPQGRALGGARAQASCASCHPQAAGLPGALALSAGQRAYRRLACAGCHRARSLDRQPVRGKLAPPLDGVGRKLRRAHLPAFLATPQRLRPGTAMPTFFGDKLLRDAPAATAARVRGQRGGQVRALSAYLLSLKGRTPAAPQTAPGAPARGRQLFSRLGCVACHRAAADLPPRASRLGGVGPDLSQAGVRLKPGWIQRWLSGPRRLHPAARMPDPRLSPTQRGHLAAYLLSLGTPAPAPPATPSPALISRGRALVQQLGCVGCHRISDPALGRAQVVGPDLDGFGHKPLNQLDWGPLQVSRGLRTGRRWTRTKLQTPLAFDRGALQMPWQQLRAGELQGLQLVLRSLTSAPAPAGLQAVPSPALRARRQGQQLVLRLGCRQCHQLGRATGAMAALLKRPSDGPPSLNGEGAKVQPGWLYRFLRRPTTLRPWLPLRMPRFNLSAAQAGQVAAYLAGLSSASYPFTDQPPPRLSPLRARQALALFQRLKCVSCHQLSNAPRLKPGELAPDLALSGRRLRRRWIRRFMLQPQQLMPGTRMPTLFPLIDEDDAKAGRVTPAPDLLGGDVERQVAALTELNLLWGTADLNRVLESTVTRSTLTGPTKLQGR